MDRGAQPILGTSARTLAPEALAADPRQRPVRIGRGALGPGRPARDLYVSPQHRIWLRSKIAARMFGTAEVLVPAIKPDVALFHVRKADRKGNVEVSAMGLPLDPNQHQAMLEIPSNDAEPGTVVQELQAGYMIKDRLLRPAMVAVAKKPD